VVLEEAQTGSCKGQGREKSLIEYYFENVSRGRKGVKS